MVASATGTGERSHRLITASISTPAIPTMTVAQTMAQASRLWGVAGAPDRERTQWTRIRATSLWK